MSQPRKITPGQTWLITRRTLMRYFLLRPDDVLNQLFLYFIAYYARKFCMRISAILVMSDHFHLALTDMLGLLPEFMRELHRMLALSIKVLRKWDGPVWEPCEPSAVAILTPQAAAQEMVYTWLNAVRAGLVADARQWPGVTTGLDDLDGPAITVKRPDFFLDVTSGLWPETIELQLAMPPILADLGHEKARQMLVDELEHQLSKPRHHVHDHRVRVLGPKQCRKASPYQRATSWEPSRSHNPVLAVGRGLRKIYEQAVAELRRFRSAYRKALEAWRLGNRDVLFPYGTWAMVRMHGARVAVPG